MIAEAPPHFHDARSPAGSARDRRAIAAHFAAVNRPSLDQEMVDRADVEVVHPLPQHEDQRPGMTAGISRITRYVVARRRVRDPVDEDREQQREDDRSRQEQSGEQ